MSRPRRVLDLHSDTVTDGLLLGYGLAGNTAHIDLLRPPPGMGWCQTFAIYITDHLRGQPALDWYRQSRTFFRSQLAAHPRFIRQVTTAREAEDALDAGLVAAILAVEGGSVLMGNPDVLEELAADGVRFLTLTWNGVNELGSGSQSNQGLTPAGFQALARMEQLGITVDISHLNDPGFWDVARAATRPFVATHSNSRTVCPHPRNLTDDQFRVMVEQGGLVGLNFTVGFLRPDGWLPKELQAVHPKTAPPGWVLPQHLLDHILHFLDLGGEDVLALGSDFDGTVVPDFLPGGESFPVLEQLLLDAGLGEALTHKILYQNAWDFLRRTDALR